MQGGGEADETFTVHVTTYFQPASDSLSAYILPISPMPMRPTTKESFHVVSWVAAIVTVLVLILFCYFKNNQTIHMVTCKRFLGLS